MAKGNELEATGSLPGRLAAVSDSRLRFDSEARRDESDLDSELGHVLSQSFVPQARTARRRLGGRS